MRKLFSISSERLLYTSIFMSRTKKIPFPENNPLSSSFCLGNRGRKDNINQFLFWTSMSVCVSFIDRSKINAILFFPKLKLPWKNSENSPRQKSGGCRKVVFMFRTDDDLLERYHSILSFMQGILKAVDQSNRSNRLECSGNEANPVKMTRPPPGEWLASGVAPKVEDGKKELEDSIFHPSVKKLEKSFFGNGRHAKKSHAKQVSTQKEIRSFCYGDTSTLLISFIQSRSVQRGKKYGRRVSFHYFSPCCR